MLGALAALLLLAGPAWIAVRSFRAELGGSYRRPESYPPAAAALGLAACRDVQFKDSQGASLRGWYQPSENGAAIILAHGSGGDRTSLADEARILAAAGFGSLLLDLPGRGLSDGTVEWGAAERRALDAALDFVLRQPDVTKRRVGVLGFSMGGYVAVQWASAQKRVRAVAITGTPHDSEEFTRYEYRQWGPLSQYPALWALAYRGMQLDELVPVDVVHHIAPRPLLVVMGNEDPHVPIHMAKQLYDRAGEPKFWHVVAGAGHGDYASAPNSDYGPRVTEFFVTALLDP